MKRKPILIITLIGLAASLVAGVYLLRTSDTHGGDIPRADADLIPVLADGLMGYARAIAPYDWEFPADHGPHLDFQTEWWYYTGNVTTESGQHFGYQFTVFRRAILPYQPDSPSEWRTNQMYMAHLTVTDVTNDRFFQHQRLSRGAAGLAGATAEPRYRVWLEDWEVFALNDEATLVHIRAETDDVMIDLTLVQIKPPALQGNAGLSPKSDERGNASYYYSLSRLLTAGTLTIDDAIFDVTGTSWMDHEFSTSALGPNAQGWDWFGLHLDDGRDLMLGQIRLIDGGRETAFGGLLVQPDGTTQQLDSSDFSIEPTTTWTSPNTGAIYPAGWEIVIERDAGEPIQLTVTPLVADQELVEGAIIYWEGAVSISGDAHGYGYAELTSYHDTMRGRF